MSREKASTSERWKHEFWIIFLIHLSFFIEFYLILIIFLLDYVVSNHIILDRSHRFSAFFRFLISRDEYLFVEYHAETNLDSKFKKNFRITAK